MPTYDLELIRRKVAKSYQDWGYTTPTDILLMTAEQIAAAARRAYPDRQVRVIDMVNVRDPDYGPEAIVSIENRLAPEQGFFVAIQATPVGVHGHNRGPGYNRNSLLAEWSDPQFAEKVAAGITELGKPWDFPPFPTDWLDAEVEDFGPLFAAWMEEAWS